MIKVLTLNLWNRTGPWEARRELVRNWIAELDPDLIGFQEVLRGEGMDQLADLAPEGFHTDFAQATEFWVDEDQSFGNAVCSRWPIVDREELPLPEHGDGETRVALSVDVDAPVGTVSFTCTHLNWKLHHGMVRERQVQAVADLVLRRRPRGDAFPPILVGDFNAVPESAEIRYLKGLRSMEGRSALFYDAWEVAGDGGPGYTWSNTNDFARGALEPDRRIDYVFVGYPKTDGTGHVERCDVVCNALADDVWPSDHFGVYAELRAEPHPDRKRLLGVLGNI